MSKKIVYFYGNCHTKVLTSMLLSNSKFNEKYQLVGFKRRVPTWYVPRMNNRHADVMRDSLKDVDIFIHQGISKNYRGEKFSTDYLKKHTNARCIWLFNYFFRGYAPGNCTSDGISNLKHEKYSENPIEFDAMMFSLYASKIGVEETFDWLSNGQDETASKFVLKVAKDDISELKRRQTSEVNLGNEILGMSDVMDTWKENQLSIYFNHPTMYYYWILCRRILNALEIEVAEDEIWNFPVKQYHWHRDDMIFNYVRKTLSDIDWPKRCMTTNNGYRNPNHFDWNLEYIETEFQKFEKGYEGCLSAYRKHKINKFFPL